MSNLTAALVAVVPTTETTTETTTTPRRRRIVDAPAPAAKPAPLAALSAEQFLGAAQALELKLLAAPKVFSTGSYGWHASQKQPATVDGRTVVVQCGLNATVVGSKGCTTEQLDAFLAAAQAAELKLVASPKQFSTGSFGWYASQKLAVSVGDRTVVAQCSLTAVVVGSKPAAQ
jgi:hypothetical protein